MCRWNCPPPKSPFLPLEPQVPWASAQSLHSHRETVVWIKDNLLLRSFVSCSASINPNQTMATIATAITAWSQLARWPPTCLNALATCHRGEGVALWLGPLVSDQQQTLEKPTPSSCISLLPRTQVQCPMGL